MNYMRANAIAKKWDRKFWTEWKESRRKWADTFMAARETFPSVPWLHSAYSCVWTCAVSECVCGVCVHTCVYASCMCVGAVSLCVFVSMYVATEQEWKQGGLGQKGGGVTFFWFCSTPFFILRHTVAPSGCWPRKTIVWLCVWICKVTLHSSETIHPTNHHTTTFDYI